MKRAVVLLSGGLDSATAAAIVKAEGFAIHALTYRYGQRHALEVEAARRVASALGVAEHRLIDIDLAALGGSALTSRATLPLDRSEDDMARGIPSTYVPARNTIFLAYALAWAEVLGAGDIVVGVNAVDYSGYPDCRPAFIEAFERLANLATKAGVEGRELRIRAPLIDLHKAEIIRRGLALGVDYALTTSCYDPSPSGEACGRCDACVLRLKGFAAAHAVDPIEYRAAAPTRP